MNEPTDYEGVPIDVPDVSLPESGFLERVAARQARAQKSYLQKVHGRSKYVPHQNVREKARRQVQKMWAIARRCGDGWTVRDRAIVWVCADCGAVVPELAVVPSTACCQARLAEWRVRMGIPA